MKDLTDSKTSASAFKQKRSAPVIGANDFPEKRPLSTTIGKPLSEIRTILQQARNFPLFLENLEKVEESGGKQSTWFFKSGSGSAMELPMSMASGTTASDLAWKAADGGGFNYSIRILLKDAQAGRGTIVQMIYEYDSAVGKIAGTIEKLFGKDAEVLTKKTLQRLKAFCETGHVPTIDGQPSGREEDLESKAKH